jgi:hypothetical protein
MKTSIALRTSQPQEFPKVRSQYSFEKALSLQERAAPPSYYAVISTLLVLLRPSSGIVSSIFSSIVFAELLLFTLKGGAVVLTTAQAVAFLIFSSQPPTRPTTSPKGLKPMSSSISKPRPIAAGPMEGLFPGRKPPGFLARGIGDVRRDSWGRKAVIEARRE